MVISYQEVSNYKLRDFSEEAGPLSEGSFGANEAPEEGHQLRRDSRLEGVVPSGIKSSDQVDKVKKQAEGSNDSDPLGSLLDDQPRHKLTKNKSQGTGRRDKVGGGLNDEI